MNYLAYLSGYMRKFLLVISQHLSAIRRSDLCPRPGTQSTARVSLYSLQTGSFPTITAGLDVFDSAGSVVTGLKPDAITLLEDNQPRPLISLRKSRQAWNLPWRSIPARLSLTGMPTPSTRYDKIVQVLKDWAANHPDTFGR